MGIFKSAAKSGFSLKKDKEVSKGRTKLASTLLRLPVGLFVVNSGINKLGLKGEGAEGLQGMAATGIPAVNELDADTLAKAIAYSEIGIGSALIAPFIPNRLAGLALTTFGSGLLTMYLGNDENTEDDGIRPSQKGLPLAKDSWLVAIGAALMALPNQK